MFVGKGYLYENMRTDIERFGEPEIKLLVRQEDLIVSLHSIDQYEKVTNYIDE